MQWSIQTADTNLFLMDRSINQEAISVIQKWVSQQGEKTADSLSHLARMCNLPTDFGAQLQTLVQRKGRIALHFHPYRRDAKGQTVLEGLTQRGYYQNQFETGISNGSLTAYPGGLRDQWENRLFGGIFQFGQIPHRLRPKYGALRLLNQPEGPSPRFGSCYLLLKPELNMAATYTYGDSYYNPLVKGHGDNLLPILVALMEESFSQDLAFGLHPVRPPELVQRITETLHEEVLPLPDLPPTRSLDSYIEAQIHGVISLKEDVDYLIADPSFRGTSFEVLMRELCDSYEIQLAWHPGFDLTVSQVPLNFRGPFMRELASSIAERDSVNAYMLAKAEEKVFEARAGSSSKLQELKYLWHVLVKFGKPIVD